MELAGQLGVFEILINRAKKNIKRIKLFRSLEVTPEEEEEIIKKVADKIKEYGMNAAAIMMLQTFKPMAYISGQTGRFFISPILYGLGEKISVGAEKLFIVFENRDNIEKLIRMLEQMTEEEEMKKKEESEKIDKQKGVGEPRRRFRRFLHISNRFQDSPIL
ncbi:hypothetical protein KEJ47_03880 [Candidatus Bathyarchaeota archaeon]|nr:hypothetical protein [Candidatus Bathyarchaeota archaeon]